MPFQKRPPIPLDQLIVEEMLRALILLPYLGMVFGTILAYPAIRSLAFDAALAIGSSFAMELAELLWRNGRCSFLEPPLTFRRRHVLEELIVLLEPMVLLALLMSLYHYSW